MSTIQLQAEPSIISLDLKETALVIIDVQKDFVCHGGYGDFLGNDVELLRCVIQPIKKLLQVWRENKLTVIHTREGHKPDLSDCPDTKLSRWPDGHRIGDSGPMGRILVIGEEGQDIVEELRPVPGELLLDKPGKNSFHKTNLDAYLAERGIKNLVVTGVTTDVCCFTTITAANDHGYNAVVLEDCVASYSPERHKAALEIITAQGGIFGFKSSSQKLLDAVEKMTTTK